MAFGSISVDKITDSEGSVFSPSSALFRNRIINGDMRIDQRNAGANVSASGAGVLAVDRWTTVENSDGTGTVQQVTDAPDGFSNSHIFTTGTADTSLAATQYVRVGQIIEGNNIADLAWGTASAKTITLSFWTKSSLTGTFGGAVSNDGRDRSYPFTYTISVADTWEYKTVTIPGETTGTWLTNNGIGLRLTFGLGYGSTYSGTAGSWASTRYESATGAVSVIGTASATWYVTGVQLEVGSVATPFERRPYGTELALCQRYFYMHASSNDKTIGRGGYYTSTQVECGIPFPVTMRATPTLFSVTGTSFYVAYRNGAGDDLNSLTLAGETTNTCAAAYNNSEASGTAGHYAHLVIANANAYIGFSAEL